MRKAIAPVVVLSLGAILMRGFSPPSHVDVSGHVYEADAATPVAGAIVSNNWDSTTATTIVLGDPSERSRLSQAVR
jgi:hypothetical protein